MPTIVVDVMPKAELLDPQGKAVAGCALAPRRRGFHLRPDRQAVRARPSRARSTRTCSPRPAAIADDILSNSVIEDVVGIEVVE